MRKLFYTIFFGMIAFALSAQTSQVSFGKNRVQHHRDFDEWMQYESDNFVTYWYGEGRFIGQAVVQLAEYDFAYIQGILEHRINEKLQIIVYVDLTDLKQSNIGNEEVFTNDAGQAKILGNKIFVYFNGDHNDLRRQVREGIASVYLESMLFGSNLQEIVQNAVLLNLPEWFKQGIVAYIGENWTTKQDGQLRSILNSGEYEDFKTFAADYPKLAGQSFWYYVAEVYGLPTLSNLLYLTRINRSVESGFLYVLGTPYEITLNDWKIYFEKRYQIDAAGRESVGTEGQNINIKNKRDLPVTQLKLSPDGQRIVYVLNEIGQYKVFMQNVNGDGDRVLLHKGGFKNAFQETDYNYPLLAWNPTGQEVAILYEHRDIPKLMRYNIVEKQEVTEDFGTEYHRVYSMEYVNPGTMVLSATVRGFSDIFLYFPATRQSQRITNDFWDDLDAVPVNVRNRSGIIFASNRNDTLLRPQRMDTILPINTFDLFYYDISNRPGELVRLTHTPTANERRPAAVDSTYFSFLSDRSGIYNQEAGYLEDYIHHFDQYIYLEDGTEIVLHADSSLSKLDTTLIDTIKIVPVIKERAVLSAISNYDSGILDFTTSPRVDKALRVFPGVGNQTKIQITTLLPLESQEWPQPTVFQNIRSAALTTIESDSIILNSNTLEETEIVVIQQPLPEPEPVIPPDTTEVLDIDNYLFQSEFSDTPTTTTPTEETTTQASPVEPIFTSPFDEPFLSSTTANNQALEKKVYRFRPGRITPYRTTFRTDFVTFNLDNALLFEGLDSYAANPDGFNTQPLSMLLKANFKDLFEDHVLEGGTRRPTTFSGSEYFLTYQNRKHRMDRIVSVYYKNQRYNEAGRLFEAWRRENNIVLGQYGLRYPLDIFRSIRATGTIRRDRVQYLATDISTVSEAPAPERSQRIGMKLEYVFDNTLDVALNMKHGTRYKVYTEFFKSFSLTLDPSFKFDFNQGFLGLAGFDFRHYQRLDKRSILAVRAAGAVSFGAQKILYYLGGTDGQLFPKFDNNIPLPLTEPDFIGLANNMRGFNQNIRNGHSYALVNTELRIPLFRYFSERIRSPFLRNFQLVGFVDAGTAWSGNSPYSDENPLNTNYFPDPDIVDDPSSTNNVTVKVVYFRDPLVFGYGVGARTLLFGYIVRLDYAWGVETKTRLDPKLHLSLGVDF